MAINEGLSGELFAAESSTNSRDLTWQGGQRMIKLTRLNGEPFVLNAELIRYVEERPDTFITLVSGDRLIVKESMDLVLDRAIVYQQTKHAIPAAVQEPVFSV